MKKHNWTQITIATIAIAIILTPAIATALTLHPPRPLIAPVAPTVPINGVIIWTKPINAIPPNYVLCNGENGTEDMRGLFIVGAGGDYALGDSGGQTFTEVIHDHYLITSPARHLAAGGDYTNATNAYQSVTDNRPPYRAVHFIMRIK